MPTRPPRQCTAPGCGQLVTTGRCATHRTRDPRPSAATRGYDRAWRRDRDRWLAGKTCAIQLPGCTGAAEVPDHWPHSRRQLVAMGVDNPNDLDRWCRPACLPCHNRRSARDRA